MRHYDAAIACWIVVDPVTHHDFSPYQAFDNNPVFWADPSGADAEGITLQDLNGNTNTISSGAAVRLYSAPKETSQENDNGDDTETASSPKDWIRNILTLEYVWDGNVTGNKNTPDGFVYVGRSTDDVENHYKEYLRKEYSILGFFGSMLFKPEYGENRTPWHGEMKATKRNWVDTWAESNYPSAAVSYGIANDFSIAFQAFNPFDNQITDLQGFGVNRTKITDSGVMTIASFIPFGRASSLMRGTGSFKQWLRFGSSYSYNLGKRTTYSIRWGASPKHAHKIPKDSWRSINQYMRTTKLPGNNWRVKDPGHFHIKL